MKTKKITKKLELNKETLINLEDSQMNEVKGGETLPTPTFFSCFATRCC